MADINIVELREDILDRLDNAVNFSELTEGLRKKLSSATRVTRAMNRALVVFARDTNPAMVKGLAAVFTLVADTGVGTAGTLRGVTTYLWPADALAERQDGGLIKLILDGNEHPITPVHMVPLDTLRFMGSSDMYKETPDSFNVDLVNKRIYALETVVAKARIIKAPLAILNANTYDSGATIPVSESFFSLLSQLGLHELLKAAGGFPNREQILAQTAPVMPQPQEDQ